MYRGAAALAREKPPRPPAPPALPERKSPDFRLTQRRKSGDSRYRRAGGLLCQGRQVARLVEAPRCRRTQAEELTALPRLGQERLRHLQFLDRQGIADAHHPPLVGTTPADDGQRRLDHFAVGLEVDRGKGALGVAGG